MESSYRIWETATENISLNEKEIHIWRAALNCKKSTFERLNGFLADEEIKFSNNYVYQRDRENFCTGRGILRELLSSYLEISPWLIQIAYNKYGKPFVALESGISQIRFNVSHSNGLVLIAVALNREVGIDLEFVSDDLSYMEIAETFFSNAEFKVLQALPEEQRLIAFFNGWTCKEAIIKAIGKGLHFPLDQITIMIEPGKRPRLIDIKDKSLKEKGLSLMELFPGKNYVAAVALAGQPFTVKCFDWNSKMK